MAKNKKEPSAIDSLMQMAERYGVSDNAMFIQAAKQYALQQRVIDDIKNAIDEQTSLTTEKTYLKGERNTYASPLIKELPKHADSANRTAQTMLNIIDAFGKEPEEEDELSLLQKDFN